MTNLSTSSLQTRSSLTSTLSIILFASLIALLSGCYSFSGANIPPGIHTIAIPLFSDQSGFAEAEIKQTMTQTLTNKFVREGSLQVGTKQNADVVLTVTITKITDEPQGVSSGETLTNKQVSISATAVYFDQKKQKQYWSRDFQQSAVYAIAQSLDGLKTALASAEDKITDDMMYAVISNW